MSKLKIALLLTLLLGLVVSVTTFAGGFQVVKYEDTSAKIDQPSKTVEKPQYILNGDFMYWENGYPVDWDVPTPTLSPDWSVHFANVDLTEAGTREGGVPPLPAPPPPPAGVEAPEPIGINPGAGYFFRTGASGSQYAGMSQQVGSNLVDGEYWVQVHMTAWEHNVQSPYNSVAWYGFGDTKDSSSVTEWRELFPDHNAWTVFVVDDISISDFSDGIDVDVTDFTDDGDVFWDSRAER